ncbi:hypothetical protein BC939DRAFT_435181 [Gamsiella multidivaricata]|uniref:uncharacterized protein n=1 Tax=Gamsiella multidivaricata TaxID=101098 RepID=UPI0022212696|nr:uncharacterized protein BC939DRAFT_435181 [Gamsiella multidivaricata]KAI7832314.1 hypothetical protein BC939DRAFT_435181 [Gamsiella multidivaricata]
MMKDADFMCEHSFDRRQQWGRKFKNSFFLSGSSYLSWRGHPLSFAARLYTISFGLLTAFLFILGQPSLCGAISCVAIVLGFPLTAMYIFLVRTNAHTDNQALNGRRVAILSNIA